MSKDSALVYHERQDSALCGQHCINNLLQGYYYSASDLADIANELHTRERETIRRSSDGQLASRDMVALLAQPNQHVDLSGNFSVEVLRTAVKMPPHELQLISLAASDPATSGDVTSHSGFIIHQSQHWYAVRKIHGHWWNLDSMQDFPIHISEFYLAAFINQQLYDGNMVFVAKGSKGEGASTLRTASVSGGDMQYRPSGQSTMHELPNLLRLNNVPVAANNQFNSVQPGVDIQHVFRGMGNRLGGSAPTGSSSGSADSVVIGDSVDEEDDDIRHAIALSLQDATNAIAPVPVSTLTETPMTEKEKMRQKRLAALNR